MKRLVLLAAFVLAVVAGPGTAQAATAPKHLGEIASAVTAEANCGCTAIQFGDLGTSNNSYFFPYSGVITRSGFYVGDEIGASDWVQMRTFAHSGTNRVTVTGDGTKHLLLGLTPKSSATFYERLPVSALGVLGARYSISSAFVEATPTYFKSPNTADQVIGTSTNLGIGDSWEEVPSQKRRVNVEAVLEPDEDGDDYGDSSQDLCLGSPIGGGPCSGTLFGSNFQTALGGSGSSGFDALYVQRNIEGASTAAPFDGVIVRWRVLSNHSDDFAIRTVSPTSGSKFSILASSASEHLAVEPSPPVGRIATFDTRLPIPAGGYVGLATESLDIPSLRSAPGSSLAKLHDGADGTVYSEPGTITATELAYDADIEPDADHDGYGDVTQDSCPGDASVHDGACPSAVRPPVRTFPTITELKVVPRRFRVKRGGAVASKRRPPAGTKFKLNLSEAATVAFSIEVKPPCKPLKGALAKCQPPVTIHTFRRNLGAGPSAVPYSGRYRKGRRIRTLDPRAYRLTASVIGPNGRRGAFKQAVFAVAP